MAVLLVEDEYYIAYDLAQALEQAGIKVIGPAASIEQAYALIDRHGMPEAAILDIKLGEEEVYPLAEELRADGVLIVFASAYSPEDLPAELAALPLWSKPYRADDLARSMQTRN